MIAGPRSASTHSLIAVVVLVVALLASTALAPGGQTLHLLQLVAVALLGLALAFGLQGAFAKGRVSARQRWDAGLRSVAERLGLGYRGLEAPDDWPRLIGKRRGFTLRVYVATYGEGPLQTQLAVELPGLSEVALEAVKRARIPRVRVTGGARSRAPSALATSSELDRALRSLSSQVELIDLDHAQLLAVVGVTYKGWDPTYGMETDPERLCELLEAMLDVAQALAPAAAASSASRLTP